MTWLTTWLTVVALPQALDGGLGTDTRGTMVNCSLVVFIVAVTPWPHVWRKYVGATGGDRTSEPASAGTDAVGPGIHSA